MREVKTTFFFRVSQRLEYMARGGRGACGPRKPVDDAIVNIVGFCRFRGG